MATHSSSLARRNPWTEEPGGLQSMGLRRVRRDWVSNWALTDHIWHRTSDRSTNLENEAKEKSLVFLSNCHLSAILFEPPKVEDFSISIKIKPLLCSACYLGKQPTMLCASLLFQHLPGLSYSFLAWGAGGARADKPGLWVEPWVWHPIGNHGCAGLSSPPDPYASSTPNLKST